MQLLEGKVRSIHMFWVPTDASVVYDIPPVPLWLVKSPPWHMKPGITRWKLHPTKKLKWEKLCQQWSPEAHNACSRIIVFGLPRSSETKSLFSSTETTEVLGGLRNNISTKFHDNASSGLAANGHIKVNFWVRPVSRWDNTIRHNDVRKSMTPWHRIQDMDREDRTLVILHHFNLKAVYVSRRVQNTRK